MSERHKAVKILEKRSWYRGKAKDSTFGENYAACMVITIMKTTRRLRIRLQKKNKNKKMVAFRPGGVRKAREMVKQARVKNNLQKASRIVIKAARDSVQAAGGKTNVHTPLLIPIPRHHHQGGFLPLIPLRFVGDRRFDRRYSGCRSESHQRHKTSQRRVGRSKTTH